MLTPIPDQVGSEVREFRRVVVVYENSAAREQAVQFCGKLAEQSPDAPELQVEWRPFEVLTDSLKADELSQNAATADFMVFAMTCEGDLPRELKLWIEGWLRKRGDREGTLVGLMAQRHAQFEIASFKEIYLRHVALRAGLDYLSDVPPRKGKTLPDSLDSFQQRAGQITSVLDEILHSAPPSTPPPSLV